MSEWQPLKRTGGGPGVTRGVYSNDVYVVQLQVIDDGMHLVIWRHDHAPVGSERWCDFMQIKNEVLGDDASAVELYPPRRQVVDDANQYHLWAYADGRSFPFGIG